MAATWTFFSRQDETIDDLLASWNMPSPPVQLLDEAISDRTIQYPEVSKPA
jgi:hypothetical protein